MDENKLDEMQTQNSACDKGDSALSETQELTADENEAASQEKSELENELEEIRDMFQKELDSAGENQLIQQLDDLDEDESEDDSAGEAEETEGRICECCGENYCSNEHGEDYPYCDECRALMKKYPMRASGIIMTLVMIAVFVATAFASANYAEDFLTVADAALNFDSGKIMTGMTGYYSYVEGASDSSISMKAVRDLLEGYSKTGYITDASSLIDRIYSETALKMPWNKKYVELKENSNALTVTYYKITEVINPAMNGEDYDYDEIMAALDALYETQPTEDEGIDKYEGVFIEYYKYVLMSISGKDVDAQLQQLKKTDEANDKNMEWAYLANLCALAAKTGDKELVDETYERLIKINKEDGNAYSALASYYRYLETPDPDKMLEICEQAKENLPSGDTSYMPTMAIAYLLQGEGSVALDTMEEYMSQNNYTVQTCNLYALCAAYNGDNDTYDQMKSLLESSGYELSSLVVKYKEKEATIKEVLTDKEGNI